jgi:hypothetical protein
MELAITIHGDELTRAIVAFLPMRLHFGGADDTDDPPWLQIDAIETARFVPHRGLRVRCAARVHYPLLVLPDDFTVEHAAIEMLPEIVAGPNGPLLAFKLAVAELDVAYFPEFVDRAVAKRINEALRDHTTTVAWDFTHTLSRMVRLPDRLQMVRRLECKSSHGEVRVTEDAIALRVSVGVSFHHDGQAVGAAPPPE